MQKNKYFLITVFIFKFIITIFVLIFNFTNDINLFAKNQKNILTKEDDSDLFKLINIKPITEFKKKDNYDINYDLKSIEKKRIQVNSRINILNNKYNLIKKIEESILKTKKNIDSEKKLILSLLQKESNFKKVRLDKLKVFFSKMEAKKAAAIISNLDKKLIISIFNSLKPKNVSEILSNMNPKQAADISNLYSRSKSLKKYNISKEMESFFDKEFE